MEIQWSKHDSLLLTTIVLRLLLVIVLTVEKNRDRHLELLWPLIVDPVLSSCLFFYRKNFNSSERQSENQRSIGHNNTKHKFLCILYLCWDTIVYIFCGVVFYAYVHNSDPTSPSVDFEVFLIFYIISKYVEQWSFLLFEEETTYLQQKTKLLPFIS